MRITAILKEDIIEMGSTPISGIDITERLFSISDSIQDYSYQISVMSYIIVKKMIIEKDDNRKEKR